MKAVNNIVRTHVRYTPKVVVETLVTLVMADNVLLLQKQVVHRLESLTVLTLAILTIPQLLKATQMMTEMYAGKVVHLHMELVVLTLPLVTILVYVHLYLVAKLVVVMTKAVVHAKEVVNQLVNQVVNYLVNKVVNLLVNQVVN